MVRLLNGLIRSKFLHGLLVLTPGLEQGPRHRKVSGERPRQEDLFRHRRHPRPRTKHVSDIVFMEKFKVLGLKKLRVANLHRVTKHSGQRAQHRFDRGKKLMRRFEHRFRKSPKLKNQDGDPVAEADSWCFRTDRDIAREEGTKYDALKGKPQKRYTSEELDRVYSLYANEEIRGPNKRYFEEVAVGDKLPTMAKGPMTVTGFIAFAQGWGGLYIRANKLNWKQISRHPGLGIANRFGIPDCPERVHWDPEMAAMVGAPGVYDYGPERCSWLTHHVTNWMGDDGFLVNAQSKIRRHNPEGDLLFIDASVAGKRVEGGRCLVDIVQEAHNQDGELSVVGSAVVALPSRS